MKEVKRLSSGGEGRNQTAPPLKGGDRRRLCPDCASTDFKHCKTRRACTNIAADIERRPNDWTCEVCGAWCYSKAHSRYKCHDFKRGKEDSGLPALKSISKGNMTAGADTDKASSAGNAETTADIPTAGDARGLATFAADPGQYREMEVVRTPPSPPRARRDGSGVPHVNDGPARSEERASVGDAEAHTSGVRAETSTDGRSINLPISNFRSAKSAPQALAEATRMVDGREEGVVKGRGRPHTGGGNKRTCRRKEQRRLRKQRETEKERAPGSVVPEATAPAPPAVATVPSTLTDGGSADTGKRQYEGCPANSSAEDQEWSGTVTAVRSTADVASGNFSAPVQNRAVSVAVQTELSWKKANATVSATKSREAADKDADGQMEGETRRGWRPCWAFWRLVLIAANLLLWYLMLFRLGESSASGDVQVEKLVVASSFPSVATSPLSTVTEMYPSGSDAKAAPIFPATPATTTAAVETTSNADICVAEKDSGDDVLSEGDHSKQASRPAPDALVETPIVRDTSAHETVESETDASVSAEKVVSERSGNSKDGEQPAASADPNEEETKDEPDEPSSTAADMAGEDERGGHEETHEPGILRRFSLMATQILKELDWDSWE